jgi:hypothetical protein
MSIIKRISDWYLFRKYGTKESAEWGTMDISDPGRQIAIRMRLAEHPSPEVRQRIMWDLTSSDLPIDREKEVVACLSRHAANDTTEDVRRSAVCSLIQQLGYGSQLAIETHPGALRALASWFRWVSQNPGTHDLYLSNMNLLSDRFFWMAKNTDGCAEFVQAVSDIAENARIKESERNQATIILARLKDPRCLAVLKRLAKDSSSYVSSNAKKALEEPELSPAKVEDVGRGDAVEVTALKRQPTQFNEEYTKNAQEAVEILFGKALAVLPPISENEVLELYEPLRYSWSSKKLVKGSTSHVRKIVLSNVEQLRKRADFNTMKVEVLSDQKCAQISVFFENSFVPVRVWSTADAVFACGNARFES